MSQLLTRIRRQPFWIAIVISVLLGLWIASGSFSADSEKTPEKNLKAPVPKVRAERMMAQEVNQEVSLYGRTEPNRQATLRAEVMGKVMELLVEEGQIVTQGQKILTLESNDLAAQIRSAQATVKQRKLELQGAKALGEKGFQSQTNQAQAAANVEMALADLERLELALSKTTIVAPFDGVMNERFVEVGDLLREGDDIATLVDLDPLIISADVTENVISNVFVGQLAKGRLASGQSVEGSIRYVSSVSNQGTNTFNIEVEVPNANGELYAGMSTQLAIPLQKTWAIKVTPAVMALDEEGNLGVKTVTQNVVEFVPINMVKSDSEGVWLSGMGREADVITLGHGFVRHGDRVEVVMVDKGLQSRPLTTEVQ